MRPATEHLFDPTRIEAEMAEAGVDILVATLAPNVQYLTRYRRPGAAIAILERGSETPVLVLPTIELDFCLEDWTDAIELRTYGTFYRVVGDDRELTEPEAFVLRHHEHRDAAADRWEVVRRELDRLNGGSATIGVDVDPTESATIGSMFESATLVDASVMMRRLRSIKTPAEISRLAEAARITDQAIVESAAIAAPGVSQRQIARAFAVAVARSDAKLRSNAVNVADGSALGNALVPDTAVEPGCVIRYDVGCFYEGYASDVARTFTYGEATDKVRTYYEALLAGQQQALDMIRPGAKPAAIFHAAVLAVRDAGLPHYERTHVGHGIGIAGAGYDLPLLAPSDDSVIEEGMVLCVETPYIELGFAGLQVEDMVVVTESGYDLLTRSSRALRSLP